MPVVVCANANLLMLKFMAMLARCGPFAPPELAANLRDEAKALLRVELDKGLSFADLRKNPTLRAQWDKPGFQELVAEVEQAGVR